MEGVRTNVGMATRRGVEVGSDVAVWVAVGTGVAEATVVSTRRVVVARGDAPTSAGAGVAGPEPQEASNNDARIATDRGRRSRRGEAFCWRGEPCEALTTRLIAATMASASARESGWASRSGCDRVLA
jgi:hypothetical protein